MFKEVDLDGNTLTSTMDTGSDFLSTVSREQVEKFQLKVEELEEPIVVCMFHEVKAFSSAVSNVMVKAYCR